MAMTLSPQEQQQLRCEILGHIRDAYGKMMLLERDLGDGEAARKAREEYQRKYTDKEG